MALLGLLAGAALAVVLPTPPTAVTKLLVVHQEDQPNDSGTLIKTDVTLLQTTRVAAAALKALGAPDRPEDFLKKYEGLGVTNNVLQITVQGASDRDAVARAQALADAYVADHVQRMRAAADAQARALINQRDQSQAELVQVDGAIADASARGSRATPGDLESLYARRADLAARVADFGKRADEARIGTPQVEAGTQIVDAPRPLPHSVLRAGATDAGVGLVLGLVAGLALAAVSSVVRDRPVLRREIAENLGASVIAQLPAARRGRAGLRRRSRGAAERNRVAVTLARAVRAEPGPVSVLELGCPGVAAALAADLAEQLAVEGPVVVVDDLPGRDLGRLGRTPEGQVRFVDGTQRPALDRARPIGLGSVAPGTAWTDLGHLGSATLLVVRAGHANAAWLHTVARQLADLRIPVIGVVLVDPDPGDSTDGTLWDALHTALRGRSAPPAAGRPVMPQAAGPLTAAPQAAVPQVAVPQAAGPHVFPPAAARQDTAPQAAGPHAAVPPGHDQPTRKLTPVGPPAGHEGARREGDTGHQHPTGAEAGAGRENGTGSFAGELPAMTFTPAPAEDAEVS
jgi:hypothetical protein